MSTLAVLRARAPIIAAAPALVLALPLIAHAQVLTRAAELFNIFVGLLLTASLLTYGLGFVVWVTRLGTWPTYRTQGVKIMEWAVAQLFVLIVLLMVVQFFRDHPTAAARTVALIIILAAAWAILYTMTKKEEPKRPPR